MRSRRAPVWWRLPGVEAAYQFVGAPSYVQMLANVAPGGNYSLTGAAYPGWTQQSGATFNGSTQYLIVPLFVEETWTVLCRFSNYTSGASTSLLGFERGGGTCSLMIEPQEASGVRTFHGGISTAAPTLTGGVVGVAHNQPYRNGLASGSTTSAWAVSNGTRHLFLGAWNYTGSAVWHSSTSIQSVLVAKRALSPAEVALASHQMTYCEFNPAWNAWARERRYFYKAPAAPPVTAEDRRAAAVAGGYFGATLSAAAQGGSFAGRGAGAATGAAAAARLAGAPGSGHDGDRRPAAPAGGHDG